MREQESNEEGATYWGKSGHSSSWVSDQRLRGRIKTQQLKNKNKTPCTVVEIAGGHNRHWFGKQETGKHGWDTDLSRVPSESQIFTLIGITFVITIQSDIGDVHWVEWQFRKQQIFTQLILWFQGLFFVLENYLNIFTGFCVSMITKLPNSY